MKCMLTAAVLLSVGCGSDTAQSTSTEPHEHEPTLSDRAPDPAPTAAPAGSGESEDPSTGGSAPPPIAAAVHCTMNAMGTCEQHPAQDAVRLQSLCENVAGEFGSGPCTDENRIGRCEGGPSALFVYEPNTPEQARRICAQTDFVPESPAE